MATKEEQITKLLAAKKKITIYVIVAVVLAVAIFFVYRAGRKKATVEQAPLPDDTPEGAIPTPLDVNIVREMSASLYSDMKGWNFWNRDQEVYKRYAQSSDRMFVAVYNDFNNQYISDDNGTLRQWLDDEIVSGEGDTLINETIIPRMIRLNLV